MQKRVYAAALATDRCLGNSHLVVVGLDRLGLVRRDSRGRFPPTGRRKPPCSARSNPGDMPQACRAAYQVTGDSTRKPSISARKVRACAPDPTAYLTGTSFRRVSFVPPARSDSRCQSLPSLRAIWYRRFDASYSKTACPAAFVSGRTRHRAAPYRCGGNWRARRGGRARHALLPTNATSGPVFRNGLADSGGIGNWSSAGGPGGDRAVRSGEKRPPRDRDGEEHQDGARPAPRASRRAGVGRIGRCVHESHSLADRFAVALTSMRPKSKKKRHLRRSRGV